MGAGMCCGDQRCGNESGRKGQELMLCVNKIGLRQLQILLCFLQKKKKKKVRFLETWISCFCYCNQSRDFYKAFCKGGKNFVSSLLV